MSRKALIFIVISAFVCTVKAVPLSKEDQTIQIILQQRLEAASFAPRRTEDLVVQPEKDVNTLNGEKHKIHVDEIPLYNPEEGLHYEGDIMEPLPILDERSGQIAIRYRWPENTVIYEFNSSFPSDFRQTFLSGLNQITGRTCIRFKQRTTESDYVHVLQKDGCSSYIGRISGRQDLSLAPGCSRFGTHVHEVIHAIGFFHEQARTDRDDFVIINWDNIESGKEHNFNKRSATEVSPFDVPYDYGSVMHYSRTSFSANGRDTITPIQSGAVIGQRDGMSDSDWLKINNMYCPRTLGIRLRNFRDNYYLQIGAPTVDGKYVITSAWTNGDHQKWTVHWSNLQQPNIGSPLVPWSQEGGQVENMYDKIRTSASTVIVRDEYKSDYDTWIIRKIGTDNNPWQVVNKGSGWCLYSAGVGANTRTIPCNATDNGQVWNIYSA